MYIPNLVDIASLQITFLLSARLEMRSKIGMLRSVIKSLSDPIEPDLNCALLSPKFTL